MSMNSIDPDAESMSRYRQQFLDLQSLKKDLEGQKTDVESMMARYSAGGTSLGQGSAGLFYSSAYKQIAKEEKEIGKQMKTAALGAMPSTSQSLLSAGFYPSDMPEDYKSIFPNLKPAKKMRRNTPATHAGGMGGF